MLQEQNSRLLRQLEQDLEQVYCQSNEPLQRLTSALKLIRQALNKLKEDVNVHPFKDKQDQVNFFKYTKPSFYQWQIYYTELYTIETGFPFGNADKQLDYLAQELHYIERFFQQYAFLYQYYKLDADELDNLYFIRGEEIQSVLLPAVPEVNPGFATSGDYLFSKFMAFDKLKDWVIEKMLYLKQNPANPLQLNNEPDDMKWTGDTINLAEIGIGIYHTKQLNNGTASLSDIFRWLEEKFRVKIGVPSKRLSELRRRKRLSRTRYLDEMKENVILKLDKDDEFESIR
ncbi:RteC domain-containing protein [Mucilaginibacter paludis]|uniref:Tetracycline regulation of excision, RteC n=1 Tax=Mucilaginibacter paludis DSM 18603 TaxID=714943 RepID=H1XZ91_9SPHI|nr:RteC domain-containing protein [Mucilaginibacter paludis]EHQ24676.1 Tetracycline regulation of excision, RteC [Mucilaginibacter paludis DSM 18603]